MSIFEDDADLDLGEAEPILSDDDLEAAGLADFGDDDLTFDEDD